MRVPTVKEVEELANWIQSTLPAKGLLVYYPIPFAEFAHLPTQRSVVQDRWEICKLSEVVVGKKVLDVGTNCGTNAFLAALSGAKSVVAIDQFPEYIHVVNRLTEVYGYGNVEARVQRLEDIDLECEQYDIIIAFSVLNNVCGNLGYEGLKRLLQKVARQPVQLFVENGVEDPGWVFTENAVPRALFESGFSKVEFLGWTYATHIKQNRFLWRCIGEGA